MILMICAMQEVTVLGFDPSSKLIQVEYTEETLMKLKHSKERGKFILLVVILYIYIFFFFLGKPGKFELQMDCEEDEGEPQVLDKSVEITLDTLIEPKLIT